MIKPLLKPTKKKKGKKSETSQKKKARLRKKADKLLQEAGRKLFKKCLVCGKPMNCLHHYHTKGCCSALRYDWNNLIPICAGCHHRHHNANDPRIHNEINKIKGEKWIDDLEYKRCNLVVKTNIGYYEKIIKILEAITE